MLQPGTRFSKAKVLNRFSMAEVMPKGLNKSAPAVLDRYNPGSDLSRARAAPPGTSTIARR
jgi:hypothetical protein